MTPEGDRHQRLLGAAHPRRAKSSDAAQLARLFTAAFQNDPVFDWIARRGPRRAAGLERFFYWLLQMRAIPFGDVWMAPDGSVATAWLPPDVPPSAGGFMEQIRLIPLFWRLCGFPRLLRGSAMSEAMDKNHPHERHYYLSFIAVAPRLQGMGLGSALLDANLARIDETGVPAYLENSNPKNTRLYERHGFARRKNIAPLGAPPLIAMWRNARPRPLAPQGSSSLSQ
ncbi:MAG: N-acetyltransferase [Rhizomicrobium sp.]|jgi:ribosomal protein S18 acetylase RimI-like enzyme